MGLEGEICVVLLLIDVLLLMMGIAFGVGAVAAAVAIAVVCDRISTGFLERFLPLCMCLSQYLESG